MLCCAAPAVQTMRAYVDMLRMEDRLYAHPTYSKAGWERGTGCTAFSASTACTSCLDCLFEPLRLPEGCRLAALALLALLFLPTAFGTQV